MKLERRQVEKPWGRTDIPGLFGETNGRRIGEVWFEAPADTDPPLLLKYIFTSEKLSIQVHPDNQQARVHGLLGGKSECWYIVEAEKDAVVGLGLRERIDSSTLREAALDGSIEVLMDWKPVKAGDFFYVPGGTIHAIGSGITLLEFQQNADVTYRLYDYGRPRELHLEEALAVARADPYARDDLSPPGHFDGILVNGPIFTLMRISSEYEMLASMADRRRWIAPLRGQVFAGADCASAGECLLVEANVRLELNSETMLLCGAEGMIEKSI